MSLTYTYADPYLTPQVTPERERRAIADIALYGTYPADWTEKLVRLRAYCIVCEECQRTADDLFTAKHKTYSKQLTDLLPLAQAAQDATTSSSGLGGVFSIPLERA